MSLERTERRTRTLRERQRERARAGRTCTASRLIRLLCVLSRVSAAVCTAHSWDRRVWRVYGDASGGGARAREESYSPAGPHTVSSALFLREKKINPSNIGIPRGARRRPEPVCDHHCCKVYTLQRGPDARSMRTTTLLEYTTAHKYSTVVRLGGAGRSDQPTISSSALMSACIASIAACVQRRPWRYMEI